METLFYFLFVMVALFVGEWVARRTHARVPSILVTAIILVVGFWTFIPKTLMTQAGYSTPFVTVTIGLLLVHLGTLMNLRKLLQQWKAALIALLGVAGTMLFTLTVGAALFGHHLTYATVPVLTGGVVSAALMSQGLQAAGLATLVAYPVSMLVMHSLFSFPLISGLLKKEGSRWQMVYHENPEAAKQEVAKETEANGKTKKVFSFGKDYDTSAFIMAKCALVALLAYGVATLTGGTVNASVLCLVFGVVFHALGFLDDNAMHKAGVFNWLMYGLLIYVLSDLGETSPSTIVQVLLQIVALVALGLLGMMLAAFVLAKPFGMTKEMAFACALTALCGFPADYIVTTDVVRSLTDDPEEAKFLQSKMLPPMLVGGFATVSLASTFVASLFVKLL